MKRLMYTVLLATAALMVCRDAGTVLLNNTEQPTEIASIRAPR